MNNEQINRAIAEACGWKWHNHPDCMAKKIDWTMPEKWIMRPDGELVLRHYIPNYCADLNAMHEAEKMLNTEELFEKYYLMLYDVRTDTLWPVCATARQRAEAFLRTLGKWDETQA